SRPATTYFLCRYTVKYIPILSHLTTYWPLSRQDIIKSIFPQASKKPHGIYPIRIVAQGRLLRGSEREKLMADYALNVFVLIKALWFRFIFFIMQYTDGGERRLPLNKQYHIVRKE